MARKTYTLNQNVTLDANAGEEARVNITIEGKEYVIVVTPRKKTLTERIDKTSASTGPYPGRCPTCGR